MKAERAIGLFAVLFGAFLGGQGGGAPAGAATIPVVLGQAPDTNLSLTIDAIARARRSLYVNIYELTSPEIARTLLGRIEAGLDVGILAEGDPVGGVSQAGAKIRDELVAAMKASMRKTGARDFYAVMTRAAGGVRRFNFDHGKYILIDGARLLIGSENYAPGGQPGQGAEGNRGWEVLIDDPSLTGQFRAIFREDSAPRAPDLIELTGHGRMTDFLDDLGFSSPAFSERQCDADSLAPPPGPSPAQVAPELADEVTPVISPDTSRAGLLALLDGARRTLDIEEMTFAASWGPVANGTPSPLFNSVLAAARRGVRVRVLLNDDTVFAHGGAHGGPPGPAHELQASPAPADTSANHLTVRLLKLAAQRERLPLHAEIAKLGAMGVKIIHNKGVLVDGTRTLISSINWNRNSVENNRETGVVIRGAAVNLHYQHLYDADWAASQPRLQGW